MESPNTLKARRTISIISPTSKNLLFEGDGNTRTLRQKFRINRFSRINAKRTNIKVML